jgi:hypothetical protein
MNISEQVLRSLCYTSLIKRLLIIFGSIGCLWCTIGLIFLLVETYHYLQNKRHYKLFPEDQLFPLCLSQASYKQDRVIDQDQNGADEDRNSVVTSVSWLSNRTQTLANQSTRQTSEEQTEATSSMTRQSFNVLEDQSTLPSFVNPMFSDVQSTRSSIVSSPLASDLKHCSVSASFSVQTTIVPDSLSPRSSLRPLPLPVVMITDCDRLQTDIIELENFEPENARRVHNTDLRFLLNDRMPGGIQKLLPSSSTSSLF